MKTQVLDHGYVELIESWGSDERIIEAARMSTGKGFLGWGDKEHFERCQNYGPTLTKKCEVCERAPGDEKLLKYLWDHKHATPFEMAGLVLEIKAPIFVFREWHRHRTQSYNEMSARYIPLPDENYYPTPERIIEGAQKSGNRQAEGTQPLLIPAIQDWLDALRLAYTSVENLYQTGLSLGIPKEVARIIVPVGRYSRMRASANLRNWLAFLTLRMHPTAQWEIQQYANAVGEAVKEKFPKTWELFIAR